MSRAFSLWLSSGPHLACPRVTAGAPTYGPVLPSQGIRLLFLYPSSTRCVTLGKVLDLSQPARSSVNGDVSTTLPVIRVK